jgi:hypothetical protein
MYHAEVFWIACASKKYDAIQSHYLAKNHVLIFQGRFNIPNFKRKSITKRFRTKKKAWDDYVGLTHSACSRSLETYRRALEYRGCEVFRASSGTMAFIERRMSRVVPPVQARVSFDFRSSPRALSLGLVCCGPFGECE